MHVEEHIVCCSIALEDDGFSLNPSCASLVLPANQYYYEEGCGDLGCNIFGENDCRQCLFDRTAYANVSEECPHLAVKVS